MMISISKILHNGNARLKLEFKYNVNLIALIRQLEGVAWSQNLKAWHIPDTPRAVDQLREIAAGFELKFEETTQKEAGKPELFTENKGAAVKKEVSIEVINRKILLKMPKNDADVKFVLTLRYSRWLRDQRLWEIPDYPGNLDLINDYFKGRIDQIKIHDTLKVDSGNGTSRSINRNEVLMIKTRTGRVKIIAGFNKTLIAGIKEIPYNRWEKNNKWWTVPFSEIIVERLKNVCKELELEVRWEEEPSGQGGVKRISKYDIPNYRRAPESYRNKHIELRSSPHTIRHYISAFEEFINYFYRYDIDSITEPQIMEFIRYLVAERQVSVSYQNVAINAIKFYYEKVLKGQRKFYFVDRPRRDKTLPSVLNVEEITAMIKIADNIKHRLIIMFAYSSGLRLGEVVRLKLSDLDRNRMQVRVEQSKGRKDRYTKLSGKILPVLDDYIREYRPVDLVFTGPSGNPYSERSVQEVVKKIAREAGVHKQVTPKTLRHTFATHCLENGVDLRYIQNMMGHESSKTTEIYTHITTRGFDKIKSPMDELDI